MTGFWTRCEGLVVDSYRLDRWLGGTAESAVYTTQGGVIRLLQVAPEDLEHQLATWTAISKLAHPHLIRLLASGHGEIDGVPLLYAVMEPTDGNLAEVLPERPLTEIEAREMLESTVDALSYLHEKGFVHRGVVPANIMAVGEQIKLSRDSITAVGMASREDDIRTLGVTLVEALTQRPEVSISGNIPEPFSSIAQHCLVQDPRARWTASQIASYLHAPEPPAHTAPPPPDRPHARAPLYWIACGFIAITAVVLMLEHHPSLTPTTAEPVALPSPSTTPVAPRQQAADTNVTPASPQVHERAMNKSNGWFVVVATYAQQADAEKRAKSMTREWPDFKAEVYAPALDNQKPYYLVIIGASLTEQAATELRDRARASGLAHDAYVTKFTR